MHDFGNGHRVTTPPVTASEQPAVPANPAPKRCGIVRQPTFALIGEDGPEAVVPLDGRSGGLGGNVGPANASLPRP